MRYGKLTAYLFTLLFAAAALVLWTLEPRIETQPAAVILTSEDGDQVITLWENDGGEYYLFLPGYAEQNAARLQIHGENVWIDGRPAEDGMSCEAFEWNTAYAFSFDSTEGRVDTILTFVRSGKLPTLYVDTGSGSMEYIHGKKGNAEAGRMSLLAPDGTLSYIGDLDAINGRGNDWLMPKKSYSLQLAAGADLLNMGQAEKWILQANTFDASHLRNKLVYDFASAAGLAYSPQSEWVDLYLNGEYAGVYLLCERNELQAQRVWPEGNEQYLVSMDVQWRLEQNARPFVTTDSGYAFRIHGSQINDKRLQQRLQAVENAISAEDGIDPLTGKHWTELVDADSWARKYLVEEVFGNGDGGAISQYFYGGSADGPLYAGPVWDYDVSMGNFLSPDVTDPQSIFAGRPRVRSTVRLSWFYELCQQEAFQDRVVALYREEYLPLLDTFLNTRLEEYLSRIEESTAMNRLRWDVMGSSSISAAEEAENIQEFMEQRIAFLNALWLDGEQFCRVLVDTDDGHGTTCFAVRPGESISYLPDYDPSPEILGWYVAGTEEPFDMEQPIWEDTEVILRRIQPETGPEESGEPEAGMQIPMKYAPFALLVVLLGILWLLDKTHRKQKAGV